MSDPVCINILFCDMVVTEAHTGKNSYIGTTAGLAHFQFPMVMSRFAVMATIGNLGSRDTLNVTFNLQIASSKAAIASGSLGLKRQSNVNFPYGVDFFDVFIPFENLQFPAPDKYLISVLLDGEEIGKRDLPVILVPRPQQQPK